MDAVIRALSIYVVLLLIFRISGRRTLSETTPFDFVLLLIIGEATQQALLGEDYSLTNSFLVIITLLGLDILLSFVKEKSGRAAKILDGVPTVLVQDGRPFEDRLKKTRVDIEDVMEEARQRHGLERLEQVKYAVLEINGGISIIPATKVQERSP